MQRKSLKLISAVLAIVLVIGCSFAYFTDYATEQASGTAGTVALSMDSNINLLDADGQDIINPGDMRDGSFTITNEGNKSIDVRTTIVMTALDHEGNAIAFTGDAATQSEYDLYLREDVELVEGYGYMPKADAQPLQVKSIDGNKITYIVPEYSLNGNSDEYAEVETIDGVDAFAHTNDFVFVMKGAAGNEWQASSVQIDVLVEAKQHENTGAGWDIVAQETITHGAISQDAVKAETVITPLDEEEAEEAALKIKMVDANGNTPAWIDQVEGFTSFNLMDLAAFSDGPTFTRTDDKSVLEFVADSEVPAGEYAIIAGGWVYADDSIVVGDAGEITVQVKEGDWYNAG